MRRGLAKLAVPAARRLAIDPWRLATKQTTPEKLGLNAVMLQIPIGHMEGNYFCDDATLEQLRRDHRIVFRYCTPKGEITAAANPNGSARNIAGIVNARGNVLGMMPHPERLADPLLGGTDGWPMLAGLVEQRLDAGTEPREALCASA